MTTARRNHDKRILLWLGGGVLLLIVAVSVIAPKADDSDPKPTTYNSGSAGAKAAYLLLTELGYKTQRWDAPTEELDQVDAAGTTLVLAEPYVAPKLVKSTTEALTRFLQRGGRLLVTGNTTLLANGKMGRPTEIHEGLCYTIPEGEGPLARVGQVSFKDQGGWTESDAKLGVALHVEQRCGDDAVVVRYAVGKGEVIWWSSAMPLTNRGLHEDASLRLLLASVGGPERTVLFDEFVHGAQVGFWDAAKGLPLGWLVAQFGLIATLLILSFSRRNGPVRMPLTVPRTSPVEFADSMGHLYARAGATNAATGMARSRLLRFLQAECGVARVTIDEGPGAIAEALEERFGGTWSALRKHLADAADAEHAELAPKSALRLVQALDDDLERLHGILAPQRAARAVIVKEDSDAELVSATKE